MPANPDPEKDKPVAIPLDPEEAIRALLKVKVDKEPTESDQQVTPE